MKIRRVIVNRRKAQFEVVTAGRRVLPFPFSELRPRLAAGDYVVEAHPDPEIGREGFTFNCASGAEGTIHADTVLAYNRDPHLMSELVLHRLTCAALDRIESAGLSRREIARRLGTSAAQLYRLLDPTNTTKSIDQMIGLLYVLGCEVSIAVKARKRAA